MSWASTADVLTYTGSSVSQDTVDAAQAIVELFADTVENENVELSTKNLRLLKLAVAYQSAWMSAQPDLFTRTDVGLMTQDGVSFTSPHANSLILAPFARRAIARLSWMRTKNQRIRPMLPKNFNRDFADPTNNDADLEEGTSGWEPL